MNDNDEIVTEYGIRLGVRPRGSHTISHYGMASCDLALSEVDATALLRAYEGLWATVERKRVNLSDPRVRLELHFIREDNPHDHATHIPFVADGPLLTRDELAQLAREVGLPLHRPTEA